MLKGSFPVEKFASLRTPFYYYDSKLLRETLDEIKRRSSQSSAGRNNPFIVHYAVKANANPGILKIISEAGLGAECVTGWEVKAAVENGFVPSGIVFSGVGKTDWEIEYALSIGIGRFNVESMPEMEVINQIALRMGVKAPVSIRVNPDIGAHTHANITTGLSENKFGIGAEHLVEALSETLALPGIEFKGLHFHIGSQILDMSDFVALCNRINNILSKLDSCGLNTGDINVGGGLGVNYEHPNHLAVADFEGYFNVFRNHLRLAEGVPVHFELGRSVVAPCGSLISRVLFVKEGETRRFAVIDAGMTDLIRPALYKAYHRIENISSGDREQLYDVVGPVCESSDVFLKATSIDTLHRGDFVAVRSAGAYGEIMASSYNCRPLPGSFID